MALTAADGLLLCPVCTSPLAIAPRTVHCPDGHSFDVARQGYVNLLRTAPPANADTSSMMAARARFLGTATYGGVAAAVADAAAEAVGHAGRPAPVVVEVGAGTAWYLAQVVEALPESRGVAVDVSPAAARYAARAHPAIASIVADTWAGLPLASGTVDVLLCIFAPRNVAEFLRLLRPGATLIVVHPNAGHLRALREESGLLDIQADKAEHLAMQLAAFERRSTSVRYGVDLSADQVADLVAMGPNAFHGHTVDATPTRVEVDVSIVVATAPNAKEPRD